MHLGLKNSRSDSTLCSNSLELLAFSSRKMLWRMVTMVLNPLPDVIFKNNFAFLVATNVFLSKATTNSDSQRLQKISVLWELR